MHRLTAAIAPRNLPKLRQTELHPVSQLTSCTFADRGPYLTTASHTLTATEPDADAGKLFVLPTEWADHRDVLRRPRTPCRLTASVVPRRPPADNPAKETSTVADTAFPTDRTAVATRGTSAAKSPTDSPRTAQ